ncbi:ECI1.2 family protein [Megaselia abdita]
MISFLMRRTIPRCRAYSSQTTSELTKVEVNEKTGVAVVTLNRPPVNGLNVAALRSLEKVIGDLETNKCKGLILSSSSKNIFCAGLDLTEIYKPDQEKLKSLWTAFQDLWIKLYGASFPTTAALNGHAIAGGCVLALSCDYRVMVPNSSIGLNETELGISPTAWIIASMQNVLSKRSVELALLQGRIYKTNQALEIGLIDEIANDKDETIKKCEEFIAKYSRVQSLAFSLTKRELRGKAISELTSNRQGDLQFFVDSINNPSVQKFLEKYLQSLKSKKN